MKFLILLFVFLTFGTNDIQQPVASYDIKPELFWLDELGITCKPLAVDIGYSAIYYEPVSNNYYRTEIEYTNNISYNTNNIKDEQNYYNFEKKFFPKLPLRYVGSTDLTNRIYIDTNNNLYVKRLQLLEDIQYEDSNNNLHAVTSQIFPVIQKLIDPLDYIEYELVLYTNKTQKFERSFPCGDLLLFERNILKPE